MQDIERRSLAIDTDEAQTLLRVERRCDCEDEGDEGREWIVGYAAKFGVNSLEIDGEFIERIDPGAFGLVRERRGRRKPLETRALWNHDANFPLGRFPVTLKLTVDDVGLRYEFPVPDTSYGKDLAANIRAGVVSGSSFSFTVGKGGDEWGIEEGRSVRLIKRVESLIDVGPVTFPAYPAADVKVARRSYGVFKMQNKLYRPTVKGHRSRVNRILRSAQADLSQYLRKHGA